MESDEYTISGMINIVYSGILNIPDRDPEPFLKIISQSRHAKNINLILSDLKTSPPFELEFNLDSLALLTKEVNRVRSLIDNDEFSSVIISLYKDKENLTSTQRKNITTIYTNLFKNTYKG